jgi:hypothetical protein
VNLNRSGLRRLVLKVHLRNTLDLLRLLLTIHLHGAGWCGLIDLHLVELSLRVVQVKLKVVKLILQEVDRSIMIHHHVLKLVDLAMELGDKSTPALELGTGLLKLLVPQLDSQVQGLSLVNQLSDGVALESL